MEADNDSPFKVLFKNVPISSEWLAARRWRASVHAFWDWANALRCKKPREMVNKGQKETWVLELVKVINFAIWKFLFSYFSATKRSKKNWIWSRFSYLGQRRASFEQRSHNPWWAFYSLSVSKASIGKAGGQNQGKRGAIWRFEKQTKKAKKNKTRKATQK